jgi:hypothetical protein
LPNRQSQRQTRTTPASALCRRHVPKADTAQIFAPRSLAGGLAFPGKD